tara:strand:- start:299 stop:883 length:585 start_codon:yes stop_codon:yes gene_type:complete
MTTLVNKLVAIQGRLKAPKNQRNNFGKYNYRSCEDILEAVKPLLAEQGIVLTITDEIQESGGWDSQSSITYVNATASITDGKDNISVSAQAGVDPNRKGMDIAQSFGSSSSYARKYALNGLFLIDDTKDADATNTHGKTATSQPQKVDTKKAILKPNTPEFDKVKNYMDNGGNIEKVQLKYNISDAAKIKLVNK